ncbi:MAG: flagellar basal body L-ring protein FlgH [Planctomycetota bacterium]|nr:flagellar basal body L-ring protein FlgH [Planctomycetota bacterium]
MRRAISAGVLGAGIAATGADAGAQSLFRQPPPPPVVDERGEVDEQAAVRGASLYLVERPKPRTIQVHDKVMIIISETSKSTSEQTLDTKKNVTLSAALEKFPNLAKFLEAELTTGNSSPIVEAEASANQTFKGDGSYERSDRFTDRVTATVIDVKPNGVVVLEARRTIQKDKEVQTLVLAGECRREDITDNNSVLSSQLADLTVRVHNEGQVKDAASKGLFTRLFEAIFNF